MGYGDNGIDVVYSVDDRTWEAANVLTGEKLFGFDGVARGRYVSLLAISKSGTLS